MANHEQKPCIFCGRLGDLSKEHIWPDWLRAVLPRTRTYNYHWVTSSGSDPKPGKIHRPGDAMSQRLRVVCRGCNGGWMSVLQSKAKPILAPMLKSGWKNLSEEEQSVLASWAAMTTMVIEFADAAHVGILQRHRDWLRINGTVPSDWKIWLAEFDYTKNHAANFNHFGWKRVYGPFGGPLTYEIGQTTGFSVGRLFFQTVTIVPADPIGLVHSVYSSDRTLWLLHPMSSLAPPADIRTINSLTEFTNFSNAGASSMKLSVMEL